MSNGEYRIELYDSVKHFYEIVKDCNLTVNFHVTPFQLSNWQQVLYEECHAQKRSGNYMGAVLFNGNAPIVGGHFFVKNRGKKKGLFFLASVSGETDYNDLLYFDSNVSNDEITKLINGLLELSKQNIFFMDRIPEDSILNRWAIDKNCEHLGSCICAAIDIQDDFQTYWNSLTKSTRQNIRTAKNRLRNDGREYKVVQICCSRIPEDIARRFKEIYEKRRLVKNQNMTFKRKLLEYLRQYRKSKYDLILHAMQTLDNIYSGYIEIDHVIAGYYFGLLDGNGTASIMHVSYDDDYKKYSPGMILLLDTIESIYETKDLKCFDLASGDEQYKFKLGAKQHLTEKYVYKR